MTTTPPTGIVLPAEGPGDTGRGERPTGVSILSVLAYIAAAMIALGAFMIMAGGALFEAMIGQILPSGGLFAAAAVFIAIITLLFAALFGAIGYGLWNGAAWAWVLTLVIEGISALGNVVSLAQGEYGAIVGLAIAGAIIWYLLQPNVKRYFGRT